MMGQYVLGIDNGGTAVKCVLFDLQGREIGSASAKTPLLTPHLHFEERDMDTLWATNADVIRRCLRESGVRGEEIIGIGCTGHGKGLYTVDSNGVPAYRGIASTDARAQSYIDRWEGDGTADRLSALTLHRPVACQPLPLLAWMRDNASEAYSRIRWVFSVKDYIRYCLTGEAYAEITDCSGSGMMNLHTQDYDSRITAILGMEELNDKLPPLKASCDLCGRVTAAAAAETGLREGTPVSGGMFDIDACAVASGCSKDGDLCVITGTWSINEYISTCPVVHATTKNSLFCIPGYYLVEESSATSAGNLEWFLDAFVLGASALKGGEQPGASVDRAALYGCIDQLVDGVSPADSDVVFVPFLYGTNEASRDRACFEGLSQYHTLAHLLRAIYEGVAFSHYTHLSRLFENREPPATLKLSGGAVRSRVWTRIFADVFGIPVETVNVKELGALGAAMSAAVAAGFYADYREAAAMVAEGETIIPDPRMHEIYMKKYRTYASVSQRKTER